MTQLLQFIAVAPVEKTTTLGYILAVPEATKIVQMIIWLQIV